MPGDICAGGRPWNLCRLFLQLLKVSCEVSPTASAPRQRVLLPRCVNLCMEARDTAGCEVGSVGVLRLDLQLVWLS